MAIQNIRRKLCGGQNVKFERRKKPQSRQKERIVWRPTYPRVGILLLVQAVARGAISVHFGDAVEIAIPRSYGVEVVQSVSHLCVAGVQVIKGARDRPASHDHVDDTAAYSMSMRDTKSTPNLHSSPNPGQVVVSKP